MRRELRELKNRHAGQDIYVLGSAASMSRLDPEFFRGRVVIGCNWVFRDFPCTYSVWMEVMPAAVGKTPPLIVPQHPNAADSGRGWGVPISFTGDYWCATHRMHYSEIGPDSDEIWVGNSTITLAMHVAAYLGARAVFLAGVDGGRLDGRVQYEGYPHAESDPQDYLRWVGRILPQTLQMRDWLFPAYGCRTYLLSPFLNFQLEGHGFEPC